MPDTVETDLTQKLETSSLQSSTTEKETADTIKAQANDTSKSINI
jgi:hypothetical protein